jgi:hypothetical protein
VENDLIEYLHDHLGPERRVSKIIY